MAQKRPSPTSLSFWEKLDLVPAGLSIFGAVLYSALTGLFRGKTGARTYRRHLFRNVIHKLITRLSLRQVTYVIAPTQATYKNWVAQKRGIRTENTVSLKSGATGLWIGDKNAKNVVIYYHGGGFSLPASADHFKYSSHLIETMKQTTNQDIAVFLLSYSLSADAVYPTQLTQAVDALHHILTSSSTTNPRSPSNIFIGGDSAGGNLAISVLLHLTHPHPEIEAEIPLSGLVTDEEPLGGVYAVAPWVSFRTDCWPSISQNQYNDIITADELQKWSAAYTAGAKPGDPWCEPFLAPAEWWEGFRAKGLLVLAGGDEILLSCVEAFVQKVREGVKEEDVVFKVGDGETHVPMAYDGQLDTIQGRELESWLASRLS